MMETFSILNLTLSGGEGLSMKADKFLGSRNFDWARVVNDATFLILRTATVWRDLEPFWGEEYTMFLPVGFTNLSVYVYDEDTIG